MNVGIIASSRRTLDVSVAIVQSASGSSGAADADTITATLPAAPTAGNSLLLFVCSNATVASPPTGFVLDASAVQSCATYVYRKQDSAGTETSVVVDPAGSVRTTWVYVEVSGLADLPVGVIATFKSGSLLSSASTGTTMITEDQEDGYAFAVHGWLVNSGAGPTTSGQTGGFTEIADVNTTVGSGPNVALAVSAQPITADAAFASTGTPSVSAKPAAIAITYRPYVAPVTPPPGTFTHGDQLTTSNIGLPSSWTPTTTSAGGTISTNSGPIEDVRYTGQVTIAVADLVFRRCKFEDRVHNNENPAYPFTIEDSEIGVTDPALIERTNGCVGNCSYTLRRCYIHDIAEGPRTQFDVLIEECYIHRIEGFGVNPHTDGVQLDGNNSIDSLPDVVVQRSWIDGRWRDFATSGSYGSSALTFNGQAPDAVTPVVMRNMTMQVIDCRIAGGGYSLRMEDGNTTWDNFYVATGNTFERGSYQYGTHNTDDSIPANITWDHNTFTDNGEQIGL